MNTRRRTAARSGRTVSCVTRFSRGGSGRGRKGRAFYLMTAASRWCSLPRSPRRSRDHAQGSRPRRRRRPRSAHQRRLSPQRRSTSAPTPVSAVTTTWRKGSPPPRTARPRTRGRRRRRRAARAATGPGRDTSRIRRTTRRSASFRRWRRATPARRACRATPSRSHALWQGSAHDARNLSCVTCHSVHTPKSRTAQLKTTTEIELCATCHRSQALKVKRVSHMPVPEGKMQCSSCHNPHGSTNVRLLRVGNWINESCVSCHTEKRGPFLFEHAAGRESCVSCHDPHGSSNDRMLVAKAADAVPALPHRHAASVDDLRQRRVQNRSNRIIGRGCVNCHQQIHGSNHPSGQTLTR